MLEILKRTCRSVILLIKSCFPIFLSPHSPGLPNVPITITGTKAHEETRKGYNFARTPNHALEGALFSKVPQMTVPK